MDYIVSAEDTPYYHWQLELLIESFKRHGLQDHLLIALANSSSNKSDFTKNISKHSRIMTHENVGRKRGYPYLNKPYAISTAINKQRIKLPFTVIEPDMLLYKPIVTEAEPITFQIKNYFTLESVQEHVEIKKYITNDLWIPLGSIYSFNEQVPLELFERAVSWSEVLAFESSKKKQSFEFWKGLERAGWVLTFLNYFGLLPFKGIHTYEMSLMDHNVEHNFIHYNNGMPPSFSKYMFKYEPPIYLTTSKTPFEAMMLETPTDISKYMQQIVQSYLQ